MNECKYNPSGKHECTHQHYCIFNTNRTDLDNKINHLTKSVDEYKHIKQCFINDEIIYHEDLDDYYVIEKGKYTGTDGNTHFKIGVSVKDGFIIAVNHKIKILEYDLKNLKKFRLDILHGKIGGYGHE